VDVLPNLNSILCHAFIQNKIDLLPHMQLLLNSSQDENKKINIHMVIDKHESQLKVLKNRFSIQTLAFQFFVSDSNYKIVIFNFKFNQF